VVREDQYKDLGLRGATRFCAQNEGASSAGKYEIERKGKGRKKDWLQMGLKAELARKVSRLVNHPFGTLARR